MPLSGGSPVAVKMLGSTTGALAMESRGRARPSIAASSSRAARSPVSAMSTWGE
jgi:hypothetical protein